MFSKALYRTYALKKEGCVSEKLAEGCDLKLMAFYAKLMLAILSMTTLSLVYIFMATGTYSR